MPASTKALITGVDLEDPQEFTDFTSEQQAAFVLLLTELAETLKVGARLLLLQTDTTELIITQEENPNMFILASLYYGDPGQWAKIASVSQLDLAVLSGRFTIKVPPTDKSLRVQGVTR